MVVYFEVIFHIVTNSTIYSSLRVLRKLFVLAHVRVYAPGLELLDEDLRFHNWVTLVIAADCLQELVGRASTLHRPRPLGVLSQGAQRMGKGRNLGSQN